MARNRRPETDPHAGNGRRLTIPLAGRILWLVRSWHARVAVYGHSMEPGLRDGDWLLVDPLAEVRTGELVVAADSRADGRLVVKRIQSIDADGSVVLAGDHPGHAGDGLRVPAAAAIGRPWFRYWPPRRLGRID